MIRAGDAVVSPVINVSWNEATDLCRRGCLSKPGSTYRLPTESEWEYAARSGGKNDIWAGTSDEKQVEDYADFANSEHRTESVGRKEP